MKKLLLTLGTATSIAAPLATVVACGDNGGDGDNGSDGDNNVVVSPELQAAYDLIEGKDMMNEASRNGGFKYDHKDVITRLYNYKEFYEDEYAIEDLITSPAGAYSTWSDQIGTSSTIILGSQGGPQKWTKPDYFDIKFDTEESRDTNGNIIGISTGNTTDGGFTTSIPFDGTHFYVAPEWNDGTNGSDLHLINPKQAQSLHHNDADMIAKSHKTLLTEDGWNMEFAFDMNLRTVAIMEVVSNYFHAKDPLKLNALTHSFGSMMLPLWQATFGWINYNQTNEYKFDDIAISAGRLEMQEDVVEMTTRGSLSSFADPVDDGSGNWTQDFNWHNIDITADQDMIDSIQDIVDGTDQGEEYQGDPIWQPGDDLESVFNKVRANFMMQGGFGALNYIDILNEYDGAYGNTTYIHGGHDTATGMLSDAERASIVKHYGTEMFDRDSGHGTDFAFDVSKPGSAWRTLGVDDLRVIQPPSDSAS